MKRMHPDNNFLSYNPQFQNYYAYASDIFRNLTYKMLWITLDQSNSQEIEHAYYQNIRYQL